MLRSGYYMITGVLSISKMHNFICVAECVEVRLYPIINLL